VLTEAFRKPPIWSPPIRIGSLPASLSPLSLISLRRYDWRVWGESKATLFKIS
jgi:hypothetical protein